MEEIINEIEKYVNYFKKEKLQVNNREDINKILNSQKYFDFIEFVYNHYNSKIQSKKNIRLCPQCYFDADRTIDYFWELLIDEKLIIEFKSKSKTILKF